MRDGSRDYFYKKLDEHFPGMKQRYIQAFGSKYECMSPNYARLTEVLLEKCQKHGILYHPDDVFGYLRRFERSEQQFTIFEE